MEEKDQTLRPYVLHTGQAQARTLTQATDWLPASELDGVMGTHRPDLHPGVPLPAPTVRFGSLSTLVTWVCVRKKYHLLLRSLISTSKQASGAHAVLVRLELKGVKTKHEVCVFVTVFNVTWLAWSRLRLVTLVCRLFISNGLFLTLWHPCRKSLYVGEDPPLPLERPTNKHHVCGVDQG